MLYPVAFATLAPKHRVVPAVTKDRAVAVKVKTAADLAETIIKVAKIQPPLVLSVES